MKKVNIANYQIGLVFENGNLVNLLQAGNYWIWGNKKVEVLNMATRVKSAIMSNELLLKNDSLLSLVEIVDVMDGEIVLLFEYNVLVEVLTAGRYAFWKGVAEYKFERINLSELDIKDSFNKALLESALLKNYVRKLVVANQNEALLFVDGKYDRLLKAGTYYFWNNNISLEAKSVDMRVQQVEVSGQELLSKDKANLRINFYVRYQISDIMQAVLGNKEYDRQLYVMVQLALREFVGALTLDELLAKKDNVGAEMLEVLAVKVVGLGLTVIDAGIRDVILTGEMKDILNQVLIAEKKAQANSIMRREETAATRSMLNTAKMMEENSVLWKLKEMEYMEKIADKIGDISLSGNSNIINQLKEIFVK